ncbi:MAG: hypothetical protein AAF598_03810 [Bacteroidota bacterium]
MQELLHIQLIEKYLSNQLGPQERTDLEIRLLTDEKLARLFHQIENAINGIRFQSRKRLLEKFKAWDRPATLVKAEDGSHLDQLDDLILGNLSQEDALALQQQIEQDAQLKSEHDELNDLIKGIQYKGRKDLFSKMKQWEQVAPDWKPSDEDRPPKRKIVLLRRIARVAAVIAIVCTAWFLLPESADHASKIEAYYSVYPNLVLSTVRGEVNVDPIVLASSTFPTHDPALALQAFGNFDGENYQQAADLFGQLLEQSYNGDIQFYHAQSLMATDQFEAAKAAFLNSEPTVSNSLIKEQAIWFAGLCMWQLDQNEQLITHWKAFSEANCKRCTDAKNILDELKKKSDR